jgi:peroxiredoxin-like protein
MVTPHRFETSVSWTGAREGKLEAEGLPSLDVASPPEFSGTAGRWTPEHFFVASAEVCVMLTFIAIADFSKLTVKGYRSSSGGVLEKVEGKGYRFTRIEIQAHVEVEKEADVERAQRLLDKAEASCLVSNSMETPVSVTAEIVVAG